MRGPLALALAGLLLSACQLPALGPSGTMTATASGALELKMQAALQTQGLEGVIARVRFELSGPNMPAIAAIEVSRDQIVAGRAAVRWDNLLPGTVHLQATIFDVDSRVLGSAAGDATIASGRTSELNLIVSPALGTATFTPTLGALGEAGASLSIGFAAVSPQSWQPTSPLAIAHARLSLVWLRGMLFALGGDYNDEFEQLDPTSLQWTPRLHPNNPTISYALGSAAALRDLVVMVGNDFEYLDAPELTAPQVFDPFAPDSLTSANLVGTWWDGAQEPRTAVAVASDGERLYVVGGVSRRNLMRGPDWVWVTSSRNEVFSAQNEQWSVGATMPTPRGACAAALLDGKLYVAGGFRWTGVPAIDPLYGAAGVTAESATKSVVGALEVYDPLHDQWATRSALPTARHSLALVAAGGRLWALGGADGSNQALRTVESYDPTSDRWRVEPPMTTARAMAGAAVLPEGSLLVAGGMDAQGRALRGAEVFNPAALP